MSRLKSLLAAITVAAAVMTGGCVTYPQYYYADTGYGGDYYYEPDPYPYYGGFAFSYGWSPYYSALWPLYGPYYYGPFFPGYFYGVTWFPHHHHWGHGGWGHHHAYAPYRHSFWDGYYDRSEDDWRRSRGGEGPRFGSASNEAERLANLGIPPSASGAANGAPPGRAARPYSRERDAFQEGGGSAQAAPRSLQSDPGATRHGARSRDGWRSSPQESDPGSIGRAPALRERAPYRDAYSVPRERDGGWREVESTPLRGAPGTAYDPRRRDAGVRDARRYDAPQGWARNREAYRPAQSHQPAQGQLNYRPAPTYRPAPSYQSAPSRSYSSPRSDSSPSHSYSSPRSSSSSSRSSGRSDSGGSSRSRDPD